MYKKLIGIFVCMLLIATFAIPISALNKVYENNPEPITEDEDVPVWEVDDSWTYNAVLFLNSSSPNQTLEYTIEAEFVLTVVDDTGDSYILEGIGQSVSGGVDLGLLGLKTTRFSKIAAQLQMRKTDLGLEFWNQNMKGILLLMIGPITLPIPIQLEANTDVEFNPTWVITPFPLYDGKNGTFDDTELMHTNSFIHSFWGLIPISGPDEYSWHTGEVPYTCTEEQVTVPAGMFDVFYITGDHYYGENGHDYYRTYYSPEAGNSVKESIHIGNELETTYFSFDLELISTTYTP